MADLPDERIKALRSIDIFQPVEGSPGNWINTQTGEKFHYTEFVVAKPIVKRPYSFVSDYPELRLSLDLPDALTPAMRDALSLMQWETGPLAHMFRANGAEIKPKAEDEQAYVLLWALRLALLHGDDWRKVASYEISKIKAEIVKKDMQ